MIKKLLLTAGLAASALISNGQDLVEVHTNTNVNSPLNSGVGAMFSYTLPHKLKSDTTDQAEVQRERGLFTIGLMPVISPSRFAFSVNLPLTQKKSGAVLSLGFEPMVQHAESFEEHITRTPQGWLDYEMVSVDVNKTINPLLLASVRMPELWEMPLTNHETDDCACAMLDFRLGAALGIYSFMQPPLDEQEVDVRTNMDGTTTVNEEVPRTSFDQMGVFGVLFPEVIARGFEDSPDNTTSASCGIPLQIVLNNGDITVHPAIALNVPFNLGRHP